MAQTHSQSKTIDGVEYEVRMLPATEGQLMLTQIGRILGPAFSRAVAGEGGIDQDISTVLASAIPALFAAAEPKEIDGILKKLAEVTLADGKPLKPIYDVHFAGKIGSLAKWAGFSLRVQYADFFDALASALGEAGLAGVMGSLSPQASTGASGE